MIHAIPRLPRPPRSTATQPCQPAPMEDAEMGAAGAACGPRASHGTQEISTRSRTPRKKRQDNSASSELRGISRPIALNTTDHPHSGMFLIRIPARWQRMTTREACGLLDLEDPHLVASVIPDHLSDPGECRTSTSIDSNFLVFIVSKLTQALIGRTVSRN